MDNIEELKKYKELFDAGVITEEEFNIKKNELLSSKEKISRPTKPQKAKKPLNPKTKKSIIFAAVAVVIVIVAIFGIKSVIDASKTTKRNEAVISHIEPIMNKYGISDYTVGDIHDGYNYFKVYAEGFESLTNGNAMELLKELDQVADLTDPCGGDTITFSTVNIYPGKDADYYYYRVSTSWVKMGLSKYDTPGIYSSYGRTCVYACDN